MSQDVTVRPQQPLGLVCGLGLCGVLVWGLASTSSRIPAGGVPPLVVFAGWTLLTALSIVALPSTLRQACRIEGDRIWIGRTLGPLRVGRWRSLSAPLRARIHSEKLHYRTSEGETSRRWLEITCVDGVARVGRQSPMPVLKAALAALEAQARGEPQLDP